MWSLHHCTLLLFIFLSAGDNATATCILPKPPIQGNYSYLWALLCKTNKESDSYNPGRAVYSGCFLHLSCNKDYRLTEQSRQGFLRCENNTWNPHPSDMACEETPFSGQLTPRESTSLECLLPEDTRHRKFFPWLPDLRGKLLPYRPGARVQGMVRVECEDGYRLANNSNYFTIVCFRGSWISGKIPECQEKIDTFPQKDPKHGNYSGCALPEEPRYRRYINSFLWTRESVWDLYTYQSGTTIQRNKLIKVQCELGYALSDYRDFIEMFCDYNTWLPKDFPECLKMCPPFESESMSVTCSYTSKVTGVSRVVDCTHGALPTTTAWYSCNPGYLEYSCLAEEGVYLRNLTCRQDGRWSNILPECKKDPHPPPALLPPKSEPIFNGCFLPEEPRNRIFSIWDIESNKSIGMYIPGVKVNGVIEVRCKDGYVLSGNKEQTSVISCNNNTWIPDQIPECTVSDVLAPPVSVPLIRKSIYDGCFLPEDPRNRIFFPWDKDGKYKPIGTYIPGARVNGAVQVRCEDGYVLSVNEERNSIISCQNNNWFPDKIPECRVSDVYSRSVTQEPPREQIIYTGCFLPEEARNRRFLLQDLDLDSTPMWIYSPGSKVQGAVLVLCEDGYLLTDNKTQTIIFCFENNWIPTILPECHFSGPTPQLYPQQLPRDQLSGGCFLPEEANHRTFLPTTENKNSKPLWMFSPGAQVDGAIDVHCEEGYTLLDNKNHITVFCFKGKWIPEQFPDCLRKSSDLMKRQIYDGALLRSVRQSDKKLSLCFLPEEARNRKFIYIPPKEFKGVLSYKPGSWVRGTYQVKCENGYAMLGYENVDFKVLCSKNYWNRTIPECIKLCPLLFSNSMHIVCFNATSTVNCSEPMKPNTKAEYFCRDGYMEHSCLEEEDVYNRVLTCELSGNWSHSLPECKLACGLSRREDIANVEKVNRSAAVHHQFPWHVGIYFHQGDDENYLCGGTLISNHVVLTAAHCVQPFHTEYLRVAAGKYYRSWDHEEEYTVRLKVSEVRIPPEYQSVEKDYAFDIALLLLSGSPVLNNFILPVCLDLSKNFTHQSTGYVVGWGKPSEDLQSSELAIHDYDSCRRTQPDAFIFDKFCISNNSGEVFQTGDRGDGVTSVFNNIHYLFGITSVKNAQTSIFTNLSWKPLRLWIEYQMEYIHFDKM